MPGYRSYVVVVVVVVVVDGVGKNSLGGYTHQNGRFIKVVACQP